MTAVTDRQMAVLRLVAAFIREHGYGPSHRQIADHFGSVGTSGVRQHLRALEDKGLLEVNYGTRRGLRLTAAGQDALR